MSTVLHDESAHANYCRMLEEGFTEIRNFRGDNLSRLEYLSDHVFGFTTYDSAMAELFARKALEVCAALSNRQTFEYIENAENYRWFLWLCNVPFFASKIEWGTSIRGVHRGGMASVRSSGVGVCTQISDVHKL